MECVFEDGETFDANKIDGDWFLFGRNRKSDPWVFMDNFVSYQEASTAMGIEGMQFDAPKYMRVKHRVALLED